MNIPDIEQLADEFGGPDEVPMLENAEEGYLCYFSSSTYDAIYINFFLIYQDEGYAEAAFDIYIAMADGEEELDLPPIGDDRFGMHMVDSSEASYAIIWRYREALIALGYSGDDDIGAEEMVRMAEAIQARLEEA